MKYPIILLGIFLLISCHNSKFTYSIDLPIEGQIYTVTQLRSYMDAQKYDQAIQLFSKKQQLKILKFRNDDEMFQIWAYYWSFDDAKFERYIQRIKNGKGDFVFENNAWKIDEK